MSILDWILVITGAVLAINYLLVRRNLKYQSQWPGPAAVPLIGCYYLYFNKKPEGIVSLGLIHRLEVVIALSGVLCKLINMDLQEASDASNA